jgi:hypothetical protein
VIAGAQDNGTKLKNAGNWTDVIGGDGMEAIIDYSNAKIMYGELYYGAIRKSTNSGSSWSALSLPQEGRNNLGAWITPYVLHPTNSSTLYVGYRNLFKTSNSGKNWTQLTNFTTGNIRVLNIAPSNPNYIYVGKSTGNSTPPMEFNRTTNGGTSWTSLTLPSNNWLSYLAISQTDPLKIWATFSGYTATEKVFYSDNGGTSWTNITGTGLPNLPVNCIVYQKDYYNRVYIGNDMGVYYKDDNTTDWTEFRSGLPNVVIDELEIQYGTMKLRAATYGRGLWEASIPTAPVYLNTPVLAQPADASTDVSINPVLSWSSVANATGYNLQYSIDNTFTTYTTITTTGTSATLTGLSYLTTYYWKVQATKNENTSSFSDSRSFTTIEEPLPAPELISPTNGAQNVSSSPTVSWNSVSGATSYDLDYSTSSTFSSKTSLTDITVTSKSISGLSRKTTYYWRVLAKNSEKTSAWSTIWKFKTASNGKFSTGENEIGTQLATLAFSPNPLSNSAHFTLDVFTPEVINIYIVDIIGNTVSNLMNEQKTVGTYTFDYDASNLLPGVYYCHLMVGNEVTTMKLVIVR